MNAPSALQSGSVSDDEDDANLRGGVASNLQAELLYQRIVTPDRLDPSSRGRGEVPPHALVFSNAWHSGPRNMTSVDDLASIMAETAHLDVIAAYPLNTSVGGDKPSLDNYLTLRDESTIERHTSRFADFIRSSIANVFSDNRRHELTRLMVRVCDNSGARPTLPVIAMPCRLVTIERTDTSGTSVDRNVLLVPMLHNIPNNPGDMKQAVDATECVSIYTMTQNGSIPIPGRTELVDASVMGPAVFMESMIPVSVIDTLISRGAFGSVRVRSYSIKLDPYVVERVPTVEVLFIHGTLSEFALMDYAIRRGGEEMTESVALLLGAMIDATASIMPLAVRDTQDGIGGMSSRMSGRVEAAMTAGLLEEYPTRHARITPQKIDSVASAFEGRVPVDCKLVAAQGGGSTLGRLRDWRPNQVARVVFG